MHRLAIINFIEPSYSSKGVIKEWGTESALTHPSPGPCTPVILYHYYAIPIHQGLNILQGALDNNYCSNEVTS